MPPSVRQRGRRLPRCFIAALPDRAGRDWLAELAEGLLPLWPEAPLDWVEPADLHLTLRFLGDLAPEHLLAAIASLAIEEGTPALSLGFRGIELWPARRPRLVVARLDGDPRLELWLARLGDWAMQQGLRFEPGEHLPHVTLLRSPRPLPVPARLPRAEGRIGFDRVVAMHRNLAARRPRYEGHAEYRLGAAAS